MKVLIIGQGIAGSLLARELSKRGHYPTVVDEQKTSSSRVAAGVMPSVTGKRYILSLEFEQFYRSAIECYDELERSFNKSFFIHKDTVRIFADETERQTWALKKDLPEFQSVTSAQHIGEAIKQSIKAPFGYSIFTKTGWCDLPSLLDHLREHFKKSGILREEPFLFDDMHVAASCITWKNEHYDAVIFCEGSRWRKNKFFNWLPTKDAKGEILLLEAAERSLDINFILNFGKWLIPLGKGLFRAGATYAWDALDYQPTDAAREEIMDAIKNYTHLRFKILDHQAGIRPAVHDLMPVIGRHPQFSNVLIFNGLGAKGVLRAPYLAKHLVDVLENKIESWKAVDVNRFKKI